MIHKKPLPKRIIQKLIEHNFNLSTCESATSGLLCSTLTNVEGSSAVIEGGYITYSNKQKINVGVSKDIIDTYGVYSKECSISMAQACIKNTGTNIGIGITGTLGNLDPNNKDSSIGVLYFTIIINDTISTNTINLSDTIIENDRIKQKEYVVDYILSKLYLLLL